MGQRNNIKVNLKKLLLGPLCLMFALQTWGGEPFWLGADVAGANMMEKRGGFIFNKAGNKQELVAMMHGMGLNAIRLRVWVNPKGEWCNMEDQLVIAKRAEALGMPVMITIHYSDTWADPGHQTIPEAWKEYDYTKMKEAVANHTIEILKLFKKNNIDVKWVQVGNETTHGMLWPMGKAEDNMEQYAGLTEAGCSVIKGIYPDAKIVIHIDGGVDPIRYNKIFNAFEKYHVNYDMIGMSCYPYWDQDQGLEAKDEHTIIDCINNINGLYKKFGKELMIVETGYDADYPEAGYKFITDLIKAARTQTGGHCHGVFYWAPEIDGGYKLGAFRNKRPTKIMDAFIEASKKIE